MSRLGNTKDVGDLDSYRDQKLVKNPDLAWTRVVSQLSTPSTEALKQYTALSTHFFSWVLQ